MTDEVHPNNTEKQSISLKGERNNTAQRACCAEGLLRRGLTAQRACCAEGLLCRGLAESMKKQTEDNKAYKKRKQSCFVINASAA